MIETLEGIDRGIVQAINACNSPFFDEFFWLISGKFTWIPLYLLLLFLVWKQFGGLKTLQFIGIVALTIALVDISSVQLFKETFQRYRPSHHTELMNVLHFYRQGDGELYTGGQYGFVSSHASNFFAITVLLGLTLKQAYPKLIYILFGIAILVCYSRLYLGVHYLSDVFVGGLWGAGLSYLSYRFLIKRFILSEQSK